MNQAIFFTRLFKILGIFSLVGLIYYSVVYNNLIWLAFSFLYYKLIVGLLGNQIAQHRYLSHNSFTTTEFKHKFLVWCSITTGIDPILYASIHRHHHVHSDTNLDPHSPSKSIIKSLFTWSVSPEIKIRPAIDLLRNQEILAVHKTGFYYLLLVIVILSLINWKFAVFIMMAGIGWNYLHMNLIRTTLVHIKLPSSYRNFDTDDNSWNNKILQAIDLGEGLHNNHHKYPNRYNQAIVPHEFDPAAFLIEKFLKVDNK